MQKCKICGINVTQLSRHMITHMTYEAKPIKCSLCDYRFIQSSDLRRHMQTTHTSRVHVKELNELKCHKCGRTFSSSRGLKKHMFNRFDCVKQFKCDECDKSFSSEKYLKDHKYIHKEEFRFSCEKCRAKFKTLQTFHDHRKKCKATFISTERAEEKEDEDQEEDNQDSLSEEESIEIEEVEMDSAFSDSAVDFKIPDVPENKNQKAKEELPNTPKEKNRKRKRRNNPRKSINSNEEKQSMKNNLTKFKCEKCGAVFAHKCSLKRHINKAFHCDYVKQFKCDECEKSFSSERYLKDHKYVHKEEFRFSCEKCGAKFKQNYILHDHRRRCKATLISTEKDTEIDADDQIEDNKDFFSEEESIEIVEVEMDSDFVDSGVEFKIPDIPEKKNRKAQKELPKSPKENQKRKRKNLKIKARQIINCVMHYHFNDKNADGSITERWLPVFEVEDFDDVLEFEKFMAKVEIGSEEDIYKPENDSFFV